MPIKPQRLSEIKKQIAEEKMLSEIIKCELSLPIEKLDLDNLDNHPAPTKAESTKSASHADTLRAATTFPTETKEVSIEQLTERIDKIVPVSFTPKSYAPPSKSRSCYLVTVAVFLVLISLALANRMLQDDRSFIKRLTM